MHDRAFCHMLFCLLQSNYPPYHGGGGGAAYPPMGGYNSGPPPPPGMGSAYNVNQYGEGYGGNMLSSLSVVTDIVLLLQCITVHMTTGPLKKLSQAEKKSQCSINTHTSM
jgi:hypothetical protein